MDTLLCNDDGDIVIGTYDPSNTLLRLSADQYTAGSATWADQSGNGLNFTVSTNTSLKGTDADGFPYMDFNGTYGSATRGSNIPAPTTGTYTVFCITQIRPGTGYRSLMFGSGDIQLIVLDGNLGLYNSVFIDSGFDVTEEMTSSRNLLVVELSQTAPMFKFKLNESGTDSIINSSANFAIPFNTIGTNGGNYWGNVYEFIVYDGVLGASERAFVAEYLAYKWAISSKLPSLMTTQGLIRNEETLAFLYAGSGTETTYTWDAEGVTYADILVVGGGGGGRTATGDYTPGGGGGGGEVVYRQGLAVTPGVEIKVGRGGPASTQGGISQFTSSIQANGGGSGGSGSGGSGGGANRNVTTGGASVKLGGGMGNVGGVSIGGTNAYGAAGGGGATQPGFNVTSGSGSNGGEGYAATVFGVWNTVYGSGGGGGDRNGTFGLGGTNAGNGGKHDGNKNGIPGVAHTGSAGGGAAAEAGRGTGGAGGSGIVLVKPNPGALDGLGTTIYTQAVGAYALRRLFGAYTGAQVRLRRSTDDEETDVTFDKYGHLVDFDLTTWIGAATAYVTTWYDQSGNGNNVTQATTSKQPKYDTTNKIEFIEASQHSLLRTPGVLAAGDDTYTFAGVFEPHTTAGQVVCEQNSSTSTTNERACVILSSGTIGHNGEGNEAHNIVAYTLNQKNRFVMRVNNGVSPNVKLNHEGTNYTATSTNPSTLNVSGYGFSIGYKLSTNTEYFDGFISEIIVFNTEISDTETNAIISLAHAIKNGPGVIPPLPLALQ